MTELLDIAAVFGRHGVLQRALPGFAVRGAQARMAERIAAAMHRRETLLVEAGTGTGKTYAYLVPALLSGLRILISTGTRALQDQLYGRDLPQLGAALGRPARVALLKGRGNYLCRSRLQLVRQQRALLALDGGADQLARVADWALITATGDLAELPALADHSPLWSALTATRDQCIGQRCAEFARCHVVEARRRAQEADIVVVNHHLLLADLALKEEGFADLLGSADAIVLDEAHQLPDLALEVFGASVSRRQIELLVADTRAEWSRAGLPATAADAALQSIERSLAALAATLPLSAGRQTLATAEPRFAAASSALCEALEGLAALPERFGATDAPAIAKCGERALALSAELRRIAGDDVEPGARSVEQHARGFTLSLLPFDIADRFAALMHARPMAWIFTSATLSVGVDFGHFAARLGLQDAATLRIDSPFDYAAQALLYLPSGLPEPAAPQFGACMLRAIWPLVEAAQGGAFLLFTSHRALAQAAVALRSGEFGAMPGPLLVQGEAPREQLLREFRRHGDAVLLGTASFWEGVDVKGDALRLVVIEKLPFASPDDPLVKARSEYLRQQGRDPFRDYQLPEAALALKQGIGRLIRSEHDRGVIAICDPRLTAKGYGRVFRACLPPMPITREPDEAVRFLRRLRTAA